MEKQLSLYIIIAVIVVVILIAAYALGNQSVAAPYAFVLKNKTYQITAVASTLEQQEKGLMNTNVTNSTFMLFYFYKSGIYSFWMKDTYTPLDIIWLNYSPQDGMAKVVYFVNATPCVNYDKNQDNCDIYTPIGSANYVIETKAGFIEQNKIDTNTQIRFLLK